MPPEQPHSDSVSPLPTSSPSPADPRFTVEPRGPGGERCLRSLAAFPAGATLLPFFAAAVHERPATMTLQVSEREHIELSPWFLSFTNHGCDPNVAFDMDSRSLVALRPIAAGDELVFFYPSTEWEMASPFACACGSPRCLRRITGASQLPEAALRGHRLAPHVRRLLQAAGLRDTPRP